MYAIIKTGGKQHRLGIGDNVKVEKLPGSKGDVIELPEVLMIADGDEVKICLLYTSPSPRDRG